MQANGYEWNEDMDAIDEVVMELISERGYYQTYHRGLSCRSASELRAEAREIIKARANPSPAP